MAENNKLPNFQIPESSKLMNFKIHQFKFRVDSRKSNLTIKYYFFGTLKFINLLFSGFRKFGILLFSGI